MVPSGRLDRGAWRGGEEKKEEEGGRSVTSRHLGKFHAKEEKERLRRLPP